MCRYAANFSNQIAFEQELSMHLKVEWNTELREDLTDLQVVQIWLKNLRPLFTEIKS